jgi:hypothetical protein
VGLWPAARRGARSARPVRGRVLSRARRVVVLVVTLALAILDVTTAGAAFLVLPAFIWVPGACCLRSAATSVSERPHLAVQPG